MHPAVLEAGGIVVPQGCLALEADAAQRGQHAQFDQQLEAVTDAEDQLALVQKFPQALQQRRALGVFQIAPAHGRGLGRAQIVAVQKAAGENQKMVALKAYVARHQIGEMHHVGPVGTGQAGRVRGFQMGIGTVAGDDQSIDCSHAGGASLGAA